MFVFPNVFLLRPDACFLIKLGNLTITVISLVWKLNTFHSSHPVQRVSRVEFGVVVHSQESLWKWEKLKVSNHVETKQKMCFYPPPCEFGYNKVKSPLTSYLEYAGLYMLYIAFWFIPEFQWKLVDRNGIEFFLLTEHSPECRPNTDPFVDVRWRHVSNRSERV